MKEILLKIWDFILSLYIFFVFGVSSIVSFVVVYLYPKVGIIALVFAVISIVVMTISENAKNRKEQ
jgi:hypothetical protein